MTDAMQTFVGADALMLQRKKGKQRREIKTSDKCVQVA